MPPRNRPMGGIDMMRAQQDAVTRVREMQERAHQNAQGSDGDNPAYARGQYRNWSTNPNMQRQNRAPRRQPQPDTEIPTANRESDVRSEPPPDRNHRHSPPSERGQERDKSHERVRESHSIPEPEPEPEPKASAAPPEAKNTTLLQDILGAVGLDDDKVLILGLILILINDKADTTLILALAYLLL